MSLFKVRTFKPFQPFSVSLGAITILTYPIIFISFISFFCGRISKMKVKYKLWNC